MTTFTSEDRENAVKYSYTVTNLSDEDWAFHDYQIRLVIDKAFEAPEKETGKLCLKIFGSYTLGKWVKKWQERLGLNLPINKKWMR
jgi:hypothetical protein